ncbi:putative DNA excision repair protein ERCC-8-like [Apostichopus japonicus]|uniref:Putative DNA excision repair protein ERCC-8-like n=1 Tax=Stichopus japonicus TaxID=307972 RepID=A0A2G8LDC3_STIJA|nr:putative DNA excision repair protein ERCC-8-like [Apostichopus japonicus]
MLSFLAERCRGIKHSSVLSVAEVTRRTYSLELSKNKDVQRIHMSSVNSLDLDPVDYRYLLSGGGDGVIAIYDVLTKPVVKELTCPYLCGIGRSNESVHKRSVETVQWYPHDTGMFVSSSMDVGSMSSKIKLCDLKTGSSTHILKGHKDAILSVQWSNKEEFLLASGSRDGKILLWDVRHASGCLKTLDRHNGEKRESISSVKTAHNGDVSGLCFTDEGLFLLSFGTDDRLRLWDIASGKNTLVNFGSVVNESGKSVKIACSTTSNPSAAFIPTVNDVDVYDLQNGEMVYDLKGHYHKVNCCVFHPHLQELYSGGNDSNILVWEPDLGRHPDKYKKNQEYWLVPMPRLMHGVVMKTTEVIEK